MYSLAQSGFTVRSWKYSAPWVRSGQLLVQRLARDFLGERVCASSWT